MVAIIPYLRSKSQLHHKVIFFVKVVQLSLKTINTSYNKDHLIEDQVSNSSLFSGPPSLVELRSSGGAGENHGCCMGVYQLLPDGGEGGSPVYRQLHDGDNEQYYLYRWDFLVAHWIQCN